MAVYSGRFLHEDIVSGSRVQATIEAQNIPVKQNVTSFRETTKNKTGWVTDSLFGFEVRHPITAISVEPALGAIVATHIRDGSRQYRVIESEPRGTRHQRVKEGDGLTIDGTIGQRINKVLTGVGAYGIGYNPQPTPQPDCKPIRKYPRDWHGENMH